MATYSSAITAKYKKYLNPDETIEFSLSNPFTITDDYQIDSIEVTMNSIVNMSEGNKEQKISVNLSLDSTYICNKSFDFKYSGTSLYFYESNLSASTQSALINDEISHVDITNNGSYALTCSSLGNGTVKVNYSKKETAPGTPTNVQLESNDVAPNSNVKLEWTSGGNGTSSSVTYYIYGGPSTYTTTNTYYTVPSSSDNGGTYTYYVKAYGSNGRWSGSSSSVTLTTTWNNPSKPSSVGFKVNDASVAITPIYIGSNDSPKVVLDWNDTSEPTNNPFTGYNVFLGNNSTPVNENLLSSSEFILSEKVAGTYTVQAMGTHGNSTKSNGAVLNIISAPTKPTITSSFTKVANNPTFLWNSVTLSNASINYQVCYTVDGIKSQWIDNGASTSYTLNLDNVGIKNDTKFTFTVRARAKATHGGYTYSEEATTDSITRAASFIFPPILWTECYGVDENDQALQNVDIYPYGYNRCKLSWNSVSTSTTGAIVKYNINYKIGENDKWNVIASNITSTSKILDLSSIAEGSSIIFQLEVNDGTASDNDSRTLTYKKLIKPSISELSVLNIRKTTIEPKFTWNNGDSSQSSFNYEIYLIYNNKEAVYYSDSFNYNDGKTLQKELFINLADGANSNSNEMIRALYNDVKGDIANGVLGLAKPTGFVKVVMYNSIFKDCKNTLTKEFIFDFSTTDLTPPTTFSIANNAKWINPNINFSYKFDEAKWTDALGNSSNQIGGKIVYSIEGNNQIKTYEIANKDYSDIVLTANDDLDLLYVLTTKVIYADHTVTASEKIRASSCIARWSSTDNISLANVSKLEGKIKGEIVLPAFLCGSKRYPGENVQSVSYEIYNNDDATTVLWSGNLNLNSITNFTKNINIPFDFISELENFSLYGIATFKNTNNNLIKKTSSSYLLRGVGVPLAIRKGRIGINVDSNFNKEEDTTKNSALYITSSSDTASILELSAGSNSINPYFINFLKGNEDYGKIFFNESDSLLHCDKWYYPVTTVNGRTGDITLTASDVKARPDTWIPATSDIVSAGTGISISGKTIAWSPTAGNGINISGNTISNTGVTAIASGTSNGIIRVTTGGNTTDVTVVQGLGTMAYASTDTYLPKSGGTLTDTLTGTTINATIFGGNAIRYGDSTPSNPVVGQIWLKPKR